jgi:hypothetical protein
MKLKSKINTIAQPSRIAMIAVIASFLAWIFPDFGSLRKGFDVAETLTLGSAFILFAWYAVIFVGLEVGQRFGASLSLSRDVKNRLPGPDSEVIYYIFTALSALGVALTFFRIIHTLTLTQALTFIALKQTNQLKNTLYDDYSAGLLSLRYLVVYSASLAIYRTARLKKKLRFLSFANITLLALATLLSSRLILIATLLISVFLLNYGKKSIKIRPLKIGIYACGLFAVLSILNYSRNGNFYADRNLSFAEAGVSEIVTYLGSPFQAAISAAKRTDDLVGGDQDLYRNYVDIEDTLNTNSAFVQLHEQMGYLCWLYIAVICCFMGFVFSVLLSFGRSVFLLPCGAILYGSAELWRLDLFQEGIFIVWFFMGIGVPLALVLTAKDSSANSKRPGRKGQLSRVIYTIETESPEPQP